MLAPPGAELHFMAKHTHEHTMHLMRERDQHSGRTIVIRARHFESTAQLECALRHSIVITPVVVNN